MTSTAPVGRPSPSGSSASTPPESAQSFGKKATRQARRYVGGKNVRVSIEDIGRYGRAVARIEVQGTGLGAMLIRDGLAWWYERYAK